MTPRPLTQTDLQAFIARTDEKLNRLSTAIDGDGIVIPYYEKTNEPSRPNLYNHNGWTNLDPTGELCLRTFTLPAANDAPARVRVVIEAGGWTAWDRTLPVRWKRIPLDHLGRPVQ